jgi:hypothetical protein
MLSGSLIWVYIIQYKACLNHGQDLPYIHWQVKPPFLKFMLNLLQS